MGEALTVGEPLALLVRARQWGEDSSQNLRGRDCTAIGRQDVAVLRLGELRGAGSGRGGASDAHCARPGRQRDRWSDLNGRRVLSF